MKNIVLYTMLIASMCFQPALSAKNTNTFQQALTQHTKPLHQAVIFSAQSGQYGVALTTVNGEEGPMEIYMNSPQCSCWELIGNGGGVIDTAPDLQSFFGMDNADATILATKLKAFLATQQ